MRVVGSAGLALCALVAVAWAYSGTPTLQWSLGGCEDEYCDYGWYSGVAVGSVSGNPTIFAAQYDYWALHGNNGSILWQQDNSGRCWPDVVLADFDDSGQDWVITGHGEGEVNVRNADTGASHAGFPANPFGDEVRAVTVGDLTGGSGAMQVVVGRAAGNDINTVVLSNGGSTVSGWPQPTSAPPYSWGIYNNNFGLFDMDGDAQLEIVSPSDVHYVNVFQPDGQSMDAANPPFFDEDTNEDKYWGTIPFCLASEMENSYCDCESETVPAPTKYLRTNFADGPVTIADLDNDGEYELVFVGRTYDFCTTGDELTRFTGLHIVNRDRTRWVASGYDWTSVPEFGTLSEPVSMDYEFIQSANYAPVTADLDGDGELEILFSSFDGKLHAFWLDKTEHCNWPYLMNTPSSGCDESVNNARFSSAPIVVDIDNDGYAEVLFTSWGAEDSNHFGALFILSSTGNLISQVALPTSTTSEQTYGGALSSPTIANVLGDSNYEVILNTISVGVVTYTLPDSASANILWGTARGSYQRTGVAPSVARTNVSPPTCPAPDADQDVDKTVTYCLTTSSSPASQLTWLE